tara:strand:- start:737 stop:1063 length:327 start_codon:yes stop_codon:yes gene_type:complete
MRIKFVFLFIFLFFSTNVFAEYRLEPVNCTIKKKDNCGAYLYNSKTGSTYFCNSTKCTEILEALEDTGTEEVKGSTATKKSKKSKIPKFGKKKKKKKSKIPKFKKKSD